MNAPNNTQDAMAAFSPATGSGTVDNLCAGDARVACPLFQAEYGGSKPTSALQLRIGKMSTRAAMQLNRQWHSRLPNLGNAFQCVAFGAQCNNVFYAVAFWSAPVARLLNGKGMYELRRMAGADDAPKNTASRMLAIMAMQIRREMPNVSKLISYQDTAVHKGTIYKAAGWQPVERPEGWGKGWGKGWQSRDRNKEQTLADKVRWEYALRESPNS